ncbi:hypothetical protein Tco_0611505 [Tanacetum coccineum]
MILLPGEFSMVICRRGRWISTDKRRARVMISAIDRKLRDQRLMRNLEKFVGGRPYGGHLRLLEKDQMDGIIFKEFQRSFRHSDTERLSRSDEVLKLNNFKKDATLKLSKSTNQEWYEHVGPEVTRSQDDKVTRWRNEIMLG